MSASIGPNAARGEAEICGHVLRPTFEALVAAEEELGPLFALVERAADGRLGLGEMVALFWHCLANRDGILRADLGDAVIVGGLAKATPALKILLGQILGGR
jgi:Phage tail tube protein, GTA-gp10